MLSFSSFTITLDSVENFLTPLAVVVVPVERLTCRNETDEDTFAPLAFRFLFFDPSTSSLTLVSASDAEPDATGVSIDDVGVDTP